MNRENKKLPEKPDNTSVLDDPLPKPNLSTERSKSVFSEVSKLVGGAEAASVAQARILELETERDQLRNEADKAVLRMEELQQEVNQIKDKFLGSDKKHREKVEILEDEKAVLRDRLAAKEKELQQLKKLNEDLELRFQSDLQKIRIKEREYENKNIILKAENSAVSKTKDEMILNLKTKIDQLQFEMLQFKKLLSEKNSNNEELKERQTRTLRALRVALSILEEEDIANEKTTKKASGE